MKIYILSFIILKIYPFSYAEVTLDNDSFVKISPSLKLVIFLIIWFKSESQIVIPNLWIIRIFPFDKAMLFGYIKYKEELYVDSINKKLKKNNILVKYLLFIYILK